MCGTGLRPVHAAAERPDVTTAGPATLPAAHDREHGCLPSSRRSRSDLGAALAHYGVSVLVLEKHPGLSDFPKATGVRPRTMEIPRSWGLESAVLARSLPAHAETVVPRTAPPWRLICLAAGSRRVFATGPVGVRGVAEDTPEVAAEVSVVGVAEVGGQPRDGH